MLKILTKRLLSKMDLMLTLVSTFIKKYQQDMQGLAIEVTEENNPYEMQRN